VIDAWKKTADDLAREAPGTNKARVINDMLKRVIPVVDQANPDYKAARNAWAGPTQYLEAIDNGKNIFNTKVSAEEMTAAVKAMGDADREGFRIGAVSAILGKMGNDGAKLGDMTKFLRSPEMRAKIAAIMPSDEAAESWARRLDFEVQSSEMTRRALGNSATARRLAEKQDAESLAGDLVMDALTGAPQSIISKVIGAGPKWLRDTMRSRADKLLADLLTNPDAINKLPGALQRTQVTVRPSDRLNASAAAGGAALLAP
jgi:hypothetical protein